MDFNIVAAFNNSFEKVSIPDRDFSGFQPAALRRFLVDGKFQSLIGILVDFNYCLSGNVVLFKGFQSLIGILVDFNIVVLHLEIQEKALGFNP